MLFFLFGGLFVNAQTPSLSIGNVGVCNNDITVSVPIKGNNFSDIGAITLFINYNDQNLEFSSIENINPQLFGIMVNTLSNPSRIALVWTNTTGATFMNDTLLNLKFTVLQHSGDLSFAIDSCEFANISLPPQVIAVNYSNGSIFEAKPTISSEPENKTVPSQSNAVFQVASPNASGYLWQESRNDEISWTTLSETNTYAGTQTNTLTIRQVSLYFNQFRYRCLLNPNSCNAVSTSAILSVDSITGIPGQAANEILSLTNSPNPFSGETTIEFSVPEQGFVTIKIFSMMGQIMGTPAESPYSKGSYRLEKKYVYLPAGIYFCHYVFKGTASTYETNNKMIKIN